MISFSQIPHFKRGGHLVFLEPNSEIMYVSVLSQIQLSQSTEVLSKRQIPALSLNIIELVALQELFPSKRKRVKNDSEILYRLRTFALLKE